jgi:predicted dehydrogenase
MAKPKPIFATDRRLRLGIWGLGRGLSFFNTCRALNMDVVAGCDFNLHMRQRFAQLNPGSYATDDVENFLAQDFDAVLLATYCPAHADDAIRCLQAGRHVLSEVTSFHTVAEGVRLVEAVEASGKVYNLAENYPFSAANMWLARKWREGLFGELMYAEYEYVHECRTLAYTYIDGEPIQPGNQAHSWRSWLNFHYYNTHSLGPMMHITGLRPTRVTALPSTPRLAGYLMPGREGMGGATPSLIAMSNGSVVRNLMGATTNDSHQQRLWGTLGSAEIIDGQLRLRLGAAGQAPKYPVVPHWDELGEQAAKTGHGGGDFWTLYYFARQILEGEPAFFDVYRAADCTLPGILAYRSSLAEGQPFAVPDLRDPRQREACRHDHFAQPRFDHRNGLFPAEQDLELTTRFSLTMRDLIRTSTAYRAYRDWRQVQGDLAEPARIIEVLDRLLEALPRLQVVRPLARRIIAAYPSSPAAQVLGEMLALCDDEGLDHAGFAADLKRERRRLAQKLHHAPKPAAVKQPPQKPAPKKKKPAAKKKPAKRRKGRP